MSLPRSSRAVSVPAALLLAVVLALTAGGFTPTQAAVLPTAVSGKVVADGQPVADATVAFLDGSKNVVSSVTTGADGTYSTSLESGSYRVRFAAEGYQTQYWSGKYTFATSDSLSLLLAGRGDVDASLTRPPTVSGHVTGGGRPAVGTEVTATGTTESGEPASATAITDASGAYSLSTPIGSYTVHFGGSNRLAAEYYQDAATAETATKVEVGVDGTKGLDADLALNHSISGTVTEQFGLPIEGATVVFTDSTNSVTETTTTGADGRFVVRLPAGTYTYTVAAKGYLSEPGDAPVVLDSTDVTIPGLIRLMWNGGIRGTVKDAAGHPVDLVKVTAYTRSGDEWTTEADAVRTDAKGAYWLMVPAGDYRLKYSAPGFATEYYQDAATVDLAQTVSLTGTTGVTGIDATIDQTSSSLSGTVSQPDGAPLSGASVVVERKVVTGETVTWERAADATTDEGGYYDVDALPGGTYRVHFAALGFVPEYADGAATAATAKAITIVPGTPAVVDATLDAATGGVSGLVKNASGPVGGVQVLVLDEAGQVAGRATTGLDGTYQTAVAPGTYRVQFGTLDGPYVPQYFDHAATLATAKKITIDATVTTKVNAVLEARKPLTGTVTGNGKPIFSAVVSLRDLSDDHVVTQTFAAEDGTYALYAAPGTYRLDVWGGDRFKGSTQDVTLTSAGLVRDVALDAKQVILGAVYSAPDHGLAGVKVTAYALENGAWLAKGYTISGSQGEYFLPATPGTYRLQLDGSAVDHATQYYDGVTTIGAAKDVVVADDGENVGVLVSTLPAATGIRADVTRLGPAAGQADALRLDYYGLDPVDSTWSLVKTLDVAPGTAGTASGLVELPAGTYRVRYREVRYAQDEDVIGPARYYQSVARFDYATSITVADGTVEPLDLSYGVKPQLTSTAAPTVSGVVRVGEVLTAKHGTWTPAGAVYAYQWLYNGEPIEGATAATYTVTPKDLGEKISVRVTASRTDYTTGTATSAEQVAVAGKISVVKAPTISGTAALGKTLKATSGTWSPGGLTYTYQWRRDTKAISGATKTSYKLTTSDVGHEVTVTVTARRTGFAALAKSSAPTAAVRTTSRLSVSASSPRAGRVVVKVSASAPGTKATGTVTIKRGSRTVARGPLKNGKVTFTLTAEPRGRRTYTATYGGSSVVPKAGGRTSVTVR